MCSTVTGNWGPFYEEWFGRQTEEGWQGDAFVVVKVGKKESEMDDVVPSAFLSHVFVWTWTNGTRRAKQGSQRRQPCAGIKTGVSIRDVFITAGYYFRRHVVSSIGMGRTTGC